MKRRSTFYLFTLLPFFFLTFLLFSCGNATNQFTLEARFKNLNQGEFYLYNLENGTLDTLVAKDGRFRYVSNMSDTITLTLLFPNYSEIPIFARAGAHVKIDGDVSHLKETVVKGTKDNDLMTAFRLHTNNLMPPEVAEEAEKFIYDHLKSPVSQYLLRHYFLLTPKPDYGKCYALCDTMLKQQSTCIPLVRLHHQLEVLRQQNDGKRLPAFKTISTDGDTVTNRQLNSQVNVIYLWASWNFSTQSTLRNLKKIQKDNRDKMSVVTICMEATPDQSRHVLKRDSITWPDICDGQLWQSPLLTKLGMTTIGDNIVADIQGKIVGRNLSDQDLRYKIEDMLK